MRRAWAASLVLAIGCTSAWNDTGPPPFTAAETNRALSNVPRLKARCYDGSESKRQGKPARLVYVLYVREDGSVHTEPMEAEPWDPELIDCMRRGLDETRFPSRGETDEIRLEFELGGAS